MNLKARIFNETWDCC